VRLCDSSWFILTYLNGSIDVGLVYADTHPHEHVLGALGRTTVYLQQVRSLQRLGTGTFQGELIIIIIM